jgi:hypothetical protein
LLKTHVTPVTARGTTPPPAPSGLPISTQPNPKPTRPQHPRKFLAGHASPDIIVNAHPYPLVQRP